MADTQKKFGFPAVFWIANWMELIERFAYYGVRVVLPVFMVEAIALGGPEFTHIQKGTVYAIWALVQSFVPIFSGGFADQYGYKINIAASTFLKMIGYIFMGFCIPFAEAVAGAPLAEARAAGVDHTYAFFFAGAMFLAFGTAIFKPGVQGLLSRQLNEKNSALGWSIFYQMVNIGGFLGPFIAGYLRILDWQYVFLTCAVGIALNFIPLFFFAEPKRDEDQDVVHPLRLMLQAVRGLLEPRLFYFTICFAGFWLMFYQLFDILPNFIDDWIDSRAVADMLTGIFGETAVPTINGGNLTQEWMINFNSLLISCFAFAFGFLTSKMRSLQAIVIGIGISAVAIFGLGLSNIAWWTFAAIGLFSIGEMMASPTKHRYLASIAPKGKDGLYMGYVNMTVGIGWSIGSVLAGNLYQENGDKVGLARKYLVDKAGVAAAQVEDLSRDKVLPFFEEHLGLDPWETRTILWDTYEPQSMWLIFTLIGAASLVGIALYDRLCERANANPKHSFNTHGHLWVRGLLVPIVMGLGYACVAAPSSAVYIQTILFSGLLVASYFPENQTSP